MDMTKFSVIFQNGDTTTVAAKDLTHDELTTFLTGGHRALNAKRRGVSPPGRPAARIRVWSAPLDKQGVVVGGISEVAEKLGCSYTAVVKARQRPRPYIETGHNFAIPEDLPVFATRQGYFIDESAFLAHGRE
jgi:hypothetical protein